jgi:3-isopropylmalate/(R)-2-methylmalate dehydratase large subunit
MGMTIAEKILARASGLSRVSPGDYVTAKIDMAVIPEMLEMVRRVMIKAGIKPESLRIWNPEKVVAVIDHYVPAASLDVAEKHKQLREMAEKLRIKYYYDIFPGVCHQIMHEKGHVRPGELIVGADSHTTTYGALNAASTGIGASDMAFVMQTGELWFMVPETIRFEISGKLSDYVYSKDIILFIAGKYSTEVAQYKAIEWTGSVVDEMSLDGRFTMSNMSVELGAKFGLFRADRKAIAYVKARTNKAFEPVEADPDAVYTETYRIDGSTIEPQVALPHSVGNVKPISEVKDIEVDQAVIASCCHGRIEDLEIAARMLKGKRVHPKVRFYAAAASWEIYKEAMDKGILRTLLDAGVMIGNPACGFCTGIQGVLAGGERCIAATPRNFKGRMGSNEAEIFLASPATVTASAIKGKIADPREAI